MKRTIVLSLMIITAIFLVACSPVVVDHNIGKTGTDTSAGNEIVTKASFAQCLTDEGAAMYGAEWCSHCKNQKELFGKAFEDVLYYECTEEIAACNAAGIKGYPTWVVDGNQYPGEQSFEKLGALTGCEVPTV